MKAALIVLAAVIGLEALMLLLKPGSIKALAESLTPNEFRLIGMFEAVIAALLLFIALVS